MNTAYELDLRSIDWSTDRVTPFLGQQSTATKPVLSRGWLTRYAHSHDKCEDRLFRDIDNLKKLKPDWDSYGASVPSAEARRRANVLLRSLLDNGLRPDVIGPCADGGVVFEFHRGTTLLIVELVNNGESAFAISYGPGKTRADNFDDCDPDINRIIEDWREQVG